MRVARIDNFGGPEVLRLTDVPIPTPGAGEVLVEVYGSSINPADVAVRNGWMHQYIPMSLPLTVGTDVAGIVVEVGDGVSELASGDPVYGAAGVMMGGSGGFAELSITRPALLAAPPARLDLVAAATLPLAGVAALQAMTEELDVQPGSRVLVHGAAGGVGLFAVALARHLGGHVVATAHGDNVPTESDIGVDDVIDTSVTHLASLEPFDLTLDLVGEDPQLPVIVTKPGGRVVGLRVMPDQEAAAARGITATLQATEITTDRLRRFRELVDEGVLRPHLAKTFELSDIAGAFRMKETGGVRGKVAVAIR
jgi:NADPH:quinone reductase-like Zn-dependent oxidoreductase